MMARKMLIDWSDLCKSANLSSDQYIVRHRYYSEEKDFGITLSNRSGLMENAEFKIKSLTEPLKNPCYIPFVHFFFRLSRRCFDVHMIGVKKLY